MLQCNAYLVMLLHVVQSVQSVTIMLLMGKSCKFVWESHHGVHSDVTGTHSVDVRLMVMQHVLSETHIFSLCLLQTWFQKEPVCSDRSKWQNPVSFIDLIYQYAKHNSDKYANNNNVGLIIHLSLHPSTLNKQTLMDGRMVRPTLRKCL